MPKATTFQPDVFTPEEARKRLRLGRNAMYDALNSGQVPSIRLGRKIMVPRVALESMLRGDAPQPKPAAGR